MMAFMKLLHHDAEYPVPFCTCVVFGKFKEYGGFLGFGMPLQLGKHFEQLPNSSCLFWMSLLVVGPCYVQSRP